MSEENQAADAVETPDIELGDLGAEGTVDAVADAKEALEEIAADGEEVAEGEEAVDGEEGEVAEGEEADVEEVAEMIRTLKLKVNGKDMEEELPFDLAPEHLEYLQKKFQMAAAGQEGMQRAAEAEKREEDRYNSIKKDPWAILEEMGLDGDELAEMRIAQSIEQMKKTPEQLQSEAMEKELEELRATLQKEKDAKEAAKFESLQKEADIEINQQIDEAISSATQLPKSAYVVKRMADAMLWAMDNGYENVKATDIAPLVEKELTKEYQDMVETMPDQVLEAFMGKKAIERLRKQRLKKHSKQPASKKIEEIAKAKEVAKPRKKHSLNDFLNNSIKDLK